MSESSLQTHVLHKLNEIPFSEWEKATVTNRAGSQDIKGHIRGYYIAIEMKRGKNEIPTKLQMYRIAQTNKKGGLSFWAYNWEDIKNRLLDFAASKAFGLYNHDF